MSSVIPAFPPIQVSLAEAQSQLALAQEQGNAAKVSYYQQQIDAILSRITVTISPKPASILGGSSLDLSVAVVGDPNNAGVTWELQSAPRSPNSNPGTLSNVTSSSVTYNAPATGPIPPFPYPNCGEYRLTVHARLIARSVTNNNITDVFNIYVPTKLLPDSRMGIINGWQ